MERRGEVFETRLRDEAGGRLRTWVLAGLALVGMLAVAEMRAATQEKAGKDKEFSVTVKGQETDAGLMVSARATAKEVGLPIYPGAKPHREDKDDSSAAKLGLWGGSFGFKLVVLKMESKDSPQKVAEFYQKALAKHGTVLDCSKGEQRRDGKDKDSDKLTCEDDKPDKGGMLFKAGTRKKQHIVAVQPNGTGSVFYLIYVEARGEEKEPV